MYVMSRVSFALWLTERREAAKLTQQDLAHAVKVHASTVSRWERGEAEPAVSELRALVLALKARADHALQLPDAQSVATAGAAFQIIGSVQSADDRTDGNAVVSGGSKRVGARRARPRNGQARSADRGPKGRKSRRK